MSNQIKCERCGRILHAKQVILLELSLTDGRYYYDIPDGHVSQGFFPFGLDCAKQLDPENKKLANKTPHDHNLKLLKEKRSKLFVELHDAPVYLKATILQRIDAIEKQIRIAQAAAVHNQSKPHHETINDPGTTNNPFRDVPSLNASNSIS